MKITQVIYEIFESDANLIDEGLQRIHEIDREIRLVDEDKKSTFISWCSDPVQYAVGIADKSFFNEPIPATRDLSDSDIWRPLIGEDIALNFEDGYHQVLKISSDNNAVYCWTSVFEQEGEDTLFISNQRP